MAIFREGTNAIWGGVVLVYPKLTVMLVLVAQIAILLVVKLIVERVTGRKLTRPQTPQ